MPTNDLAFRALKPTASGQTWGVVLAAGEGSRLRALTTTADGVSVPKQFCSLRTGPSLLHEALQRAEAIAPRERICAVVARQHAHWWCEPLEELWPANVFIQPRNRGTAVGMLLALAHIAQRDADARVVILPSDHHVEAEELMSVELQRSVDVVCRGESAILLLGIEPDDPDPGLGYIQPGGNTGGGTAAIARFVEKPTVAEARALIAGGALWNSFIMAARVDSLLALFAPRYAILARRMQSAVRRATRGTTAALDALYMDLPNVDFSRDIVPGQEAALHVSLVPPCGWTDLGTVQRVEKTLLAAADRSVFRRSSFDWPGRLSLEQQRNDVRKSVLGSAPR